MSALGKKSHKKKPRSREFYVAMAMQRWVKHRKKQLSNAKMQAKHWKEKHDSK